MAAFYRSSPKNEARMSENMPNRQTFVSLQKETYVQRAEEVSSLVETSKLSRDAIKEKLKAKKNKPSGGKKKKKDTPANLEKQDYDEYELDNVEDD